MLQAMGKIHHEVGSTEYNVWYKALNDFTEKEFIEGVKAVPDHTGYLDLPAFRTLIRLTKSHKSHRYLALEKPKNLLSGDELRARIAEMKKQLNL